MNALALGALRRFTQWPWIKSHLSIETRSLYHWATAAPAKYSSPMPRCHAILWCAMGVTEEPTIREKRLSWPWLFTVILSKAFLNRFWEKGQYKLRTTGALLLLVCGRMSSLSFVQKTFDWGGGNIFVWRVRCRDWVTIAPQVSVLRKPWFKDKHWGSLAHWIWPRLLSKHFINLLTPQPHVVFF